MISIIVPVYNTERYLRECIDTILAQAFTGFELLLIDDGSMDKSGEICDEYAKRDFRVRAFHKKNGGVSSARNMGLDNAKGEWICFVDSDDTITEDYLEVLWNSAKEYNADSSMGGFRYVDSERSFEIVPRKDGVESVEDNIKGFYVCEAPDWQRYLWNRMFSADVIRKNSLHFNEKLYYKEDGLFLIQFLCVSNGRVGVTSHTIYNYRQNAASAMGNLSKSFNPKLLTNLKSHNLIVKTLKKNKISNEVLVKAIAHAKQSSEWVRSMMKRSNSRCLANEFIIELVLCDTLGLWKYLCYKNYLLFGKIYRIAKKILCIN